MNEYIETSKKEFYNIINDLDICVNSKVYDYPEKHIVTMFTYRNGTIFGKSIQNMNLDSDDYGKKVYFIKKGA